VDLAIRRSGVRFMQRVDGEVRDLGESQIKLRWLLARKDARMR
jgi:hypothetical protein